MDNTPCVNTCSGTSSTATSDLYIADCVDSVNLVTGGSTVVEHDSVASSNTGVDGLQNTQCSSRSIDTNRGSSETYLSRPNTAVVDNKNGDISELDTRSQLSFAGGDTQLGSCDNNNTCSEGNIVGHAGTVDGDKQAAGDKLVGDKPSETAGLSVSDSDKSSVIPASVIAGPGQKLVNGELEGVGNVDSVLCAGTGDVSVGEVDKGKSNAVEEVVGVQTDGVENKNTCDSGTVDAEARKISAEAAGKETSNDIETSMNKCKVNGACLKPSLKVCSKAAGSVGGESETKVVAKVVTMATEKAKVKFYGGDIEGEETSGGDTDAFVAVKTRRLERNPDSGSGSTDDIQDGSGIGSGTGPPPMAVTKRRHTSASSEGDSMDGMEERLVVGDAEEPCECDECVLEGATTVEKHKPPQTLKKQSSWKKIRNIVHWSPFIQQFKRRRYPWIQLAGHQGNFQAGEPGAILKKYDKREHRSFNKLMSDVLRSYVPEYRGEVEKTGDCYLQLQDLLCEFEAPCVMDIKMGCRTYLEEELSKAREKPTLRKDMYKKMIEVDPTAPTEEENEQKAITKPRYMQWRDDMSSSVNMGFRIEGIRKSDGAQVKNFKTTKDSASVKACLKQFVEENPVIINKYLRRLKAIRVTQESSPFFQAHEVIGSSLLFVHDKCGAANIWMIDFGKTVPLPEEVKVTHRNNWEEGNHEDGYLTGVDSLIDIFEELRHEFQLSGSSSDQDESINIPVKDNESSSVTTKTTNTCSSKSESCDSSTNASSTVVNNNTSITDNNTDSVNVSLDSQTKDSAV